VTQFDEALRYNPKVAGSIPDIVIFIHITLRSVQPLKEMSTRNVLRDVKVAGA
jgi:hypothetical protein